MFSEMVTFTVVEEDLPTSNACGGEVGTQMGARPVAVFTWQFRRPVCLPPAPPEPADPRTTNTGPDRLLVLGWVQDTHLNLFRDRHRHTSHGSLLLADTFGPVRHARARVVAVGASGARMLVFLQQTHTATDSRTWQQGSGRRGLSFRFPPLNLYMRLGQVPAQRERGTCGWVRWAGADPSPLPRLGGRPPPPPPPLASCPSKPWRRHAAGRACSAA